MGHVGSAEAPEPLSGAWPPQPLPSLPPRLSPLPLSLIKEPYRQLMGVDQIGVPLNIMSI